MVDIALIRKFTNHLPLCRGLGIQLVESEELIFKLPYNKKIIGNPQTRVIHGGAISTLLDTACGAVVFTHSENTQASATVDLRIDYMKPALPDHDVFATAEVYQTTRHIAFAQGLAWDNSRKKPIAMATSTFTFSKELNQ